MTKKLYLDDSYLQSAEATVLSCTPVKDGFDVELTQTVLFPTGGGQPSDTGMIGSGRVFFVREEDGRVLHRTDQPVTPGETCLVTVDWLRRFDHMQQHSGEHILSYAAHALYGAHNVGFHMAEEYATIDLDLPLTAEQTAAVEERAFSYITQNLLVSVDYVTPEALSSMQLRKEAKGLTGDIRIVSMSGTDSCTCCGTHVRALGEVGFIKIAAAERYKGGTRLTFHCGQRALSFVQRVQAAAEGIAKSLSVEVAAAGEAVAKLQGTYAGLRREVKGLYERLTAYLAEEILAGAVETKGTALCVALLSDLPPAQLKPLAQSIVKTRRALCLLCAETGESVQYLLCCSDGLKLDMGELCEAVNAATGGRGGGRGTLAQGSAKAAPGQAQAVEQLKGYLTQRLKAM